MDMEMQVFKLLLPSLWGKCNKIVSLLRCATKKKVIVAESAAGCTNSSSSSSSCCCCRGKLHLLWLLLLLLPAVCLQLSQAAPSLSSSLSANETDWPQMHHYDIWSADLKTPEILFTDGFEREAEEELELVELPAQELPGDSDNTQYGNSNSNRQGKVIHLFPVPVDGECLSDDGRRMGNCFNAYECRQKGGQARGECAMGFGVCCVFVADCNATIANNHTYIVSPGFPSFMPSNFTECKLRVKLMSGEISQLRLDFNHFSLGQPNRRTGVCDGDIFSISGGPRGAFRLCGQNSGQHLYYDVSGRSLPRQGALYGSLRPAVPGNQNTTGNSPNQQIEITLNVSRRFLPMRLWEIRVLQIPSNQQAPPGCLQYHTGAEGIIQTFNFAENGRHLANQHYRVCVRQEVERCSISYQPCDEQSFRIGGGLGGGTFLSAAPMTAATAATTAMNNGTTAAATAGATTAAPATTTAATTAAETTEAETTTTPHKLLQLLSNWVNQTKTTAETTTTAAPTTAAPAAAVDNGSNMPAATTAGTTAAPPRSSTTPAAAQDDYPAYDDPEEEDEEESPPANDDVEGSGDNGDGGIFSFFGGGNRVTTAQPGVSRKPRPVGGGGSSAFDLFGFLRSAFDLRHRRRRRRRREARQFFSTCADRITMPCIIEDFIGTGFGPLPGCEPIHCGAHFCSSGVWPCRIESTVTPFYIGVHFGNGGPAGSKGNAEDNIGACLRYEQLQCV